MEQDELGKKIKVGVEGMQKANTGGGKQANANRAQRKSWLTFL